mmetsp:Transcript_41795/g.110171  ORF Transcript_41795/g.110171 Transcript_41795/m.110171 type:complete len:290 (-) Transcript_41795:142-1011(-)
MWCGFLILANPKDVRATSMTSSEVYLVARKFNTCLLSDVNSLTSSKSPQYTAQKITFGRPSPDVTTLGSAPPSSSSLTTGYFFLRTATVSGGNQHPSAILPPLALGSALHSSKNRTFSAVSSSDLQAAVSGEFCRRSLLTSARLSTKIFIISRSPPKQAKIRPLSALALNCKKRSNHGRRFALHCASKYVAGSRQRAEKSMAGSGRTLSGADTCLGGKAKSGETPASSKLLTTSTSCRPIASPNAVCSLLTPGSAPRGCSRSAGTAWTSSLAVCPCLSMIAFRNASPAH